MEEKYWNQFAASGRVEDYLWYKGIQTCQNIMERYEDKGSESVKYSNRNDTVGNTDRRI